MAKFLYRMIFSIMAITLLTGSLLPAVNANSAETVAAKPELVAATPVTAGAVLKEYYWENDRGPAKIFVTEVDLNNPYIELGVISGQGKLTQRLNVTAMARNTGAVAAINGDFYNMQGEGVPIGPVVNDGRLMASPSKLVGWYALGITADRKAHIEAFTFAGRVTAPSGTEFKLSGVNKTQYWEQPEGNHSHVNSLHLYNDLWGGKTRGHDSYTTPTEVLVTEGKVVDISQGKYFDFPVPEGAYILRGHGEAAKFLVNNFQIGDPVGLEYAMEPDLNWSMVLGGYSLLVDDGKAVPLPREVLTSLEGLRARSAAGISKDGKTLYLVGVEGRTEASKGLHLSNLAIFFEEIGAWKAINLDGGGSTTMAARPLGEFDAKRVFATEQTTERLVVNALGVYSTAPQGKLEGLIISGNQVILVGEEAAYSLKAYDQYYNPVDSNQLPVRWTKSGELGSLLDNVFTANRAGTTEIIASVNSISARLPVEVAGRKEVSRLVLKAGTGNTAGQVAPGQEVPLTLTMHTISGKTRQVPASLVDWQFYNLKGEVTPGGRLIIRQAENGGQGIVVARYQGYSAPLFLTLGQEQQLAAFDRLDNMAFVPFPQEVKGQLRLVPDPAGQGSQNGQQGQPAMVTALDYDFTGLAGSVAAYVRLGEAGHLLDQQAYKLALDVYGHKGNQWLRAEILDGSGTIQRVDLANSVNWEGWKTVELDLTKLNFARPLTLRRVYVVASDGQQDQRAVQGTLHFRNLRLWYERPALPVLTDPESPVSLELTVGKKQMTVNGTETEMDVAPVIINGRTLVPVRFVSQALNGAVLWDGATRNVTVVRQANWIDLWVDDNLMVVNGEAISLEVPPELISDRTMLPLRAVAEVLGLTVEWHPETQGITLRN